MYSLTSKNLNVLNSSWRKKVRSTTRIKRRPSLESLERRSLMATTLFDFETPTSPVAAGAVGVTPTDRYSATKGYGWGSTEALDSRDRGGSDLLTRDFVMGWNSTFL